MRMVDRRKMEPQDRLILIARICKKEVGHEFETMYFEKEGRIGYLTLNRPQLLNIV